MKTASVTPLVPSRGAASRGLRIAMVAPPYFALPPIGYGGVEVVVAGLVDELVERGHHITLLGAGRNGTRAQTFVSTYAEPPADQLGAALPEVVHAARVGELLAARDFDLVHDHTLAGPLLARGRRVPTVVTVHGPATGDVGDLYRALGDSVRLISISDAQRAAAPDLPWLATVHNAIPVSTFPFQVEKDDVALFLGRFHPEKAPHLAIDAARAVGLPIVLAGKCSEPVELGYFAREIEPRLGPDVEIFGVADADQKRRLLARACCLLFPICWEEPFGLVMIEAMACGTPVVAFRRGAVPEIVVDGVTGVIVDEPGELPGAIRLARRLDPHDCRAHVEQHFGTAPMVTGYELAYRRLLDEERGRSPAASASR